MTDESAEIEINVDDKSIKILDDAYFTESAKRHFKKVMDDYSNLLFDNAKQESRNKRNQEVNEENIRDGAFNLNRRPAKNQWLKIALALSIQLLTAGIGVGASNIKESWGIILFGLTLFSALIANLILFYQIYRGE